MEELERLVGEFAEHVAAQTDEIGRGNAQKGNRHAERYIQAFKSLRAMGDRGREALVPLMYTGRADVRCMAAAFLLRYRTEAARRVLEELSNGTGLSSFSAGESLKRWAEGAWSLDPP